MKMHRFWRKVIRLDHINQMLISTISMLSIKRVLQSWKIHQNQMKIGLVRSVRFWKVRKILQRPQIIHALLYQPMCHMDRLGAYLTVRLAFIFQLNDNEVSLNINGYFYQIYMILQYYCGFGKFILKTKSSMSLSLRYSI